MCWAPTFIKVTCRYIHHLDKVSLKSVVLLTMKSANTFVPGGLLMMLFFMGY